jgi:micrococcal nuclease
MDKKTARLIAGVVAAAATFIWGYLHKQQITAPWGTQQQFYKEGEFYKVTYVFDGDTIEIEGGQRVRLIGIDTPECYPNEKAARDSMHSGVDVAKIVAMGEKAKQFSQKLLQDKRVRLEFDLEKKDKYDRLLAYIYLEDGTFVNAQIVQEGFANLMTIPPNIKYVELFNNLYKQARANKKGLWKDG